MYEASAGLLCADVPTLVGIFPFPLRYFEVHRLKPDWSPSSTISSAIGRPTRTSTSISFPTVQWEMAVHAQALPLAAAELSDRGLALAPLKTPGA
jgi:hypothetical protein